MSDTVKKSVHLTEKLIKSIPAPSSGAAIKYDDEIKGFGIRVTKNGVKAFVLNYVINGRERRMTIGQYPAWSVTAARAQASKYKQQVDTGSDPLQQKQDDRKGLTIKDLWREYTKRHIVTFSSAAQKDVASMYEKYISVKLGENTKVADVTGADIEELHRFISAKVKVGGLTKKGKPSKAQSGGKTRANRVLEIVRSMFNKGIQWGYCEKNPAHGFRKNVLASKNEYLQPEQLQTVFEKLSIMENKKAANIIRLLILTGARIGELLKSEWTHFDLDRGLWTKPAALTKQRRVHIIPLSPEAVGLLRSIKSEATAGLVFPSAVGGYIHDIKKPWQWLRKEAGIEKYRIHDLRHTYASLLISNGETLAVIGKLLGHSQNQTTMRYAHLFDEPLRNATNKIGNLIPVRK